MVQRKVIPAICSGDLHDTHAALLVFFEVLLKGNVKVRKDKTIKEENKFQNKTIFKKSSGLDQDFQR